MPQMLPYTLELQWVTAVAIIGFTIVALACYLLPYLVKKLLSRSYLASC